MIRFLVLSLFLLLSGCATMIQSPDAIQEGISPENLYQIARSHLREGSYKTAISYYQALDVRFSNHPRARQADVELAYAYYKNDKPEQALAACNRFLKVYSTDKNVDYILYLKGVIIFEQNLYTFAHFFKQSPADRDPKNLNDSFDVFKELVTRYPKSIYAPSAQKKLSYLSFLLARHDYDIGLFYFKRQAYSAALSRFQGVILQHPRTPLKEKILALMIDCYRKMGMNKAAADTQRVLIKNYPDTINREGYLSTHRPLD